MAFLLRNNLKIFVGSSDNSSTGASLMLAFADTVATILIDVSVAALE